MATQAKLTSTALSRRTFLASSAGAGLLMGLGVTLPGCSREEAAMDIVASGGSQSFAPSIWFEIDASGAIVVHMPKAEMGQHVGTALARIIADELGANWDDISLKLADSDPKWGLLQPGVSIGDITGGSWSVFTSFAAVSQGAAAGRTVLIEAGAALMGVDVDACSAQDGLISAEGQHASFAEIVSKGDISRSFSAEELAAMPIKAPGDRRLIGKPSTALDIPDKAMGTTVYGIDAELPGMVFGLPLVPPTRWGSSINSVDDSAAKSVAGYQQTLVLTDPTGFLSGWAVVIADDFPAAMKAAKVVVVDWEAGATASVSEADIQAEGREKTADKSVGTLYVDDGDVTAARAAADDIHTAVYQTATAMHYTLEPQNALVEFVDGKCHIHAGNQYRARIIPLLASVLEMPEEDIHLHQYHLGGGFGRRLVGDQMIPAALAAKALGKPVKLVFPREEDSRFDCVRSPSVQQFDASYDADGNLTGIEHAAAAGWSD